MSQFETSSSAPHLAAPRIAVLIGGSQLDRVTANALARHYGSIHVLVEQPEPKSVFVRRRLKRLGALEVAGQLAFAALHKTIASRSAARIAAIHAQHDLDAALPAHCSVHHVGSVNGQECRDRLRAIDPQVVVVHGTRIIKRETLDCVRAPFINYHAGINPKYRGQHGGYWARANRDAENFGVTVHLVDSGVDTGAVLYQERVTPTSADTISTYQHLQAALAQPLIVRAVEDALAGTLRPRRVELPSRQWYHPTLWGYLWTGLARGVW